MDESAHRQELFDDAVLDVFFHGAERECQVVDRVVRDDVAEVEQTVRGRTAISRGYNVTPRYRPLARNDAQPVQNKTCPTIPRLVGDAVLPARRPMLSAATTP